MARSALPTKDKRAILTSEAFRRLISCHPELPDKIKAGFLTDFCHAMKQSGHSEQFRNVVVRKAVGKFIRAWEMRTESGKEVYRSKEEKREFTRLAGGKSGKSDWFLKLGYQNTVTVPATIGSSLAKKVESALAKTDPPGGYKTLVLEDGGVPLRSDMIRSNPFPIASCGRKDCLMCSHTPSLGRCWSSNVTYSIKCKRSPCSNEETPTPTYVGETSRPGHKGGSEHLALYQNRSKTSFMWRHCQLAHEGKIGELRGVKDFEMERIGTYRKALKRTLEEAVLIQGIESNSKTESLNSKDEYFVAEIIRPCFPKGPAQVYQ